MANIVLRPCCAGWKLLPEHTMRGWPVFMIERPMILVIVVVLVIVAFTAIGVLLSGYGNCC